MLEKTLGVTLVTKLQAILLMEANFNATNKIIYGMQMMSNAQGHQLVPKEIFSKKNRMADDGTLCKILFYDITRQARVPVAIALVDASNCYDRIAHAMALLIFQAFGVPLTAVETMLRAIKNMKFSLQTGFGDSASFTGGGISIKHRGSRRATGNPQQDWRLSASVFWGRTGKRDTEQNSTVQSPTNSITYRQLFTWITLTCCTLI
jgi:hypothetical protein